MKGTGLDRSRDSCTPLIRLLSNVDRDLVYHRSPLETTFTHSKELITHFNPGGKLFNYRIPKKFENDWTSGSAARNHLCIGDKPTP